MVNRVIIYIVLNASFLWLAHPCYATPQEVWRIASLEWQPYSGSQLPGQGSAIKKLRTLLAHHNIKLEVDFLPWLRAKKIVQIDSRYLGIYPAWPEDGFSKGATSPPIDCSTIAIFTQTDREITFHSIHELFNDYTVGVVRAYSYPRAIEQAMIAHPNHVSRAHNTKQLVKMLGLKRHEVAISDPKVITFYSKELNIQNIKHVTDIEKKELVVIMGDLPENNARIKRFRAMTQQVPLISCDFI